MCDGLLIVALGGSVYLSQGVLKCEVVKVNSFVERFGCCVDCVGEFFSGVGIVASKGCFGTVSEVFRVEFRLGGFIFESIVRGRRDSGEVGEGDMVVG